MDVGEGDAILVQTPGGRTMLIDGGGTRSPMGGDQLPAEDPIGERVVVPFLRSRGISEIDVLVITHPHGDHIGGLAAVVRDLKVDSVLDGAVLPYPSASYRRLVAEVQAKLIPYQPARRGAAIDFGDGVHADLLNPPAGDPVYGTDMSDQTINDYSAVVRLSYGKTVFLLDGDAEAEAEQNMIAAYPLAYLRADMLKAGHHGSRNASSDEWLNAVMPKYAALSCGKNNLFLHPHSETLNRLAAHHVKVYRTDINGDIEFDSDGQTVKKQDAS